ncbi:hypothetical protein KGQ25_00890 [Patescibacteria group bacterium]|nr:hypothetical protein [Patescibacteria group bacterium]MDE2021611.1 hypothetical protein [Patescibacteria group bacterium]MDE2173168.1 hypothetical protein [Patescibacteria group bacterium]
MNQLNPRRAGLAVGVFAGGAHLIWAVLVAFGWAQALVNFILWAHMMSTSYIVAPFDLTAAATLVILTTIIGYVAGDIFALIWNRMHRA